MGIPGLLPLLKDITNKRHIKDFAGKRAAIDGYGWLYKGAYSCAKELCEDTPTDKCAFGFEDPASSPIALSTGQASLQMPASPANAPRRFTHALRHPSA